MNIGVDMYIRMIRQRIVTNNETKLYTPKWDKYQVMDVRRRRSIHDIDYPNAPHGTTTIRVYYILWTIDNDIMVRQL